MVLSHFIWQEKVNSAVGGHFTQSISLKHWGFTKWPTSCRWCFQIYERCNIYIGLRYNYSHYIQLHLFNPRIFEWNITQIISKIILVIGAWGICYNVALGLMPLDLTDGKSTLFQVMPWCHQETSHYPSQCWPSSVPPHCVARPQ